MPVLCMFFGIIVRMYKESGGKYNLPHIHAEYSGEEVVVSLDSTILEGCIPKAKMKLLDAWMEIHRDELEADWKLLSNGEQFFRIDPLR
ncbi:MAG: DUF4160 domain-containing protein [Oscillibacter sp.]|nr:DUF4160 domain-containing protein [Oscillibacter sp.]MBQ9617229.1 DUF4160 domain-containing protein [Oscillibacter sp.]